MGDAKNEILDLFNVITLINELIKWDNELIKCLQLSIRQLTSHRFQRMCDHQQSP